MRNVVPYIILAVALVIVIVRRRQRARAKSPDAASWRPFRDRDAAPVLGLVGLVAGREIRQRLRGRVFLIATLVLLAGVAAAIVIPVATKGKTHPQQVGVVGTVTPALRTAVATAAAGVHVDARLMPEADREQAEAALRSGTVHVAIDGDRLIVKKAASSTDTSQAATFVRALAQVLGVDRALRDAGLSPEQRATLSGARPLPVTGLEPATRSTPARSTATIGLIVLFLMLTQYLTWTLVGVMEEKSSRVVEVLLATVRPLQLLTGKLLGIGTVVFAQAAVVVAFALVLARAVGSDLLHGTAPLVVLTVLLWLLLGYVFFSWLYAAVGSMAERQDQVQSLAIPVSLPLIVGYILSLSALGPGGTPPTYLEVLAYLPPTAPFAMTAMVGMDAVTWWQFVISALLTLVSTLVVARLAAGIYRRAILRTGRRVHWREVVRGRAAHDRVP